MKYNYSIKINGLNLEKGYKEILSDFNLSVKPGQAVKVIGPNGSGKTSLLRTIARLNRIHDGEILVASANRTQPLSPRMVNFIGHSPAISLDLSVFQNLIFYTKITEGKAKYLSLEESLKIFKIRSVSQLSKNLSAGQKQRVSLCKLLLFEAPVWILDEPFNSLDSDAQETLEEQIENHQNNGGVVFLTSHQSFKEEEKFRKVQLN